MPSPFRTDKGELLERVLDHFGARFRTGRFGWQKISCISEAGHVHGDRNPSASVNLTEGKYHCHACGLSGDGFDLMLELEGWKADRVLAEMGMQANTEPESDWIL